MLSATNSVADVKARIGNGYATYGYASDNAYTTAIQAALDDAKLLEILPRVSSTYYDTVALKDKVSLGLQETYLYNAEVCFAAVKFLSAYRTQSGQFSGGRGESITAEGYSRSTSGSGPTGMDIAIMSLWNAARGYMSRAGFRVTQIKRAGAMHAETDPTYIITDEASIS